MSAIIKDWFYRITHNGKKWEMVLWWVFRGIMIYGLIDSFVNVLAGKYFRLSPKHIFSDTFPHTFRISQVCTSF